jgi:hypothetical protein
VDGKIFRIGQTYSSIDLNLVLLVYGTRVFQVFSGNMLPPYAWQSGVLVFERLVPTYWLQM